MPDLQNNIKSIRKQLSLINSFFQFWYNSAEKYMTCAHSIMREMLVWFNSTVRVYFPVFMCEIKSLYFFKPKIKIQLTLAKYNKRLGTSLNKHIYSIRLSMIEKYIKYNRNYLHLTFLWQENRTHSSCTLTEKTACPKVIQCNIVLRASRSSPHVHLAVRVCLLGTRAHFQDKKQDWCEQVCVFFFFCNPRMMWVELSILYFTDWSIFKSVQAPEFWQRDGSVFCSVLTSCLHKNNNNNKTSEEHNRTLRLVPAEARNSSRNCGVLDQELRTWTTFLNSSLSGEEARTFSYLKYVCEKKVPELFNCFCSIFLGRTIIFLERAVEVFSSWKRFQDRER